MQKTPSVFYDQGGNMHISIFYYSVTGTTEEFARLIANALLKENHHVEITKLKTNPELTKPESKFEILNMPDCAKFDILIIGGPVWAFRACPVVLEFIRKSNGITGRKVIPFVTMGFPFKCLGGTNAIKQMGDTANRAGCDVQPGIIIPKLFHDFKRTMEQEALKIASSIKGA